MNKVEKACMVAVEKQKMAYGEDSEETKITKLLETDELYLIIFRTPGGKVIYGGGGCYIVHKENFAIQHFNIPSYPANIFEILDAAKEIEIPEKYKFK